MTFSRQFTASAQSTVARVQGVLKRWHQRGWWRIAFAGLWLAGAAAATALKDPQVRSWELQVQTLQLVLRGPVATPDNIVILAIDDQSMGQGEFNSESMDQAISDRPDANRYAEIALLQKWPWPRQTYGIVIQRLMDAGAKAVAIDIMFSTPSTYGPADDAALAEALDRYGNHVVLAGKFDENATHQGMITTLEQPISEFLNTPIVPGIINMPTEPDGRIHQLGYIYLEEQIQKNQALDTQFTIDSGYGSTLSFADATLQQAGIDYPAPSGSYVNFYGPHQAFEHISFWEVLDSDAWNNRQMDAGVYLKDYFKDKIVLIGATADILQDYHASPFGETLGYSQQLAGVEIQANAIATLQAGNALRPLLPSAIAQGGLVMLVGLGFGAFLWRINRPITRLGWTTATSGLWFGISFLGMTVGNLIIPTAMPIITIMGIGTTYVVADIFTEQLRKQRLRKTLAQYATSPIVQEIISQQDDFQDLLKAREAEVIGMTLGGRYEVVKLLGSGGFGETYVAKDTQRPGSPDCVVKQLKIVSDDPKAHQLAHRLFVGEAVTLEQLGHHDQIPRLLAYFEAQYSFYLVEELIEGHLLQQELAARRSLPQLYVLDLLKDLLPIVDFVHSKQVIHRDIKPANIIRRQADKRLVLIDFGAVKQISNQLTDMHAQPTATVGIGTQGYMPSEQSAGLPRLCSDLYAIGIIAIEALTGIPAYALQRDKAGEIIWRFEAPDVDPQFADILIKLTRYNFSDRYQRAVDVLADLEPIEAILRSQGSEEEVQALQILESPAVALADEPVSEFDDIGTQALPEDWGDMAADTATRDQQRTQATEDDSTQVLPSDWAAQETDSGVAITQEQLHTRQD